METNENNDKDVKRRLIILSSILAVLAVVFVIALISGNSSKAGKASEDAQKAVAESTSEMTEGTTETTTVKETETTTEETTTTVPETESTTESETEPTTESETQPTSEPETTSATEPETPPEPTYPDMTGARRIWVGDSRVVGLSECGAGNPDEDIFIAKSGRYYVWFYNDALPVLRSYLDTGAPYEVIIQIGINDCANTQMQLLPYFAEDYVTLINSLIDEYPAARFWFLSVGEVIGTYGAGTQWEVQMEDLNPLVAPFNETMRAECRAIYLPVGELIKEQQRSYRDTVHYSVETNQWIYSYVLSAIQEKN